MTEQAASSAVHQPEPATKSAGAPAPQQVTKPKGTPDSARITPKAFLMNVLNGLAIGTVVSLIPGALLGSLLTAIQSHVPGAHAILMATQVCNSLMGVVIGVMIGTAFKFTPIQTASLGLAVMIGGGAFAGPGTGDAAKALMFKGTGDIINMGLVGALAAGLILLIGKKARAFTILVIPLVSVAVAGGIGLLTLPYVKRVTQLIGLAVAHMTSLQPILMVVLLAMVFSLMIVSPVTTVGIALAISLSGIGSGAANIGICVAGFGLTIAGWKVNSMGTSIAHCVGSPKISMANVMTKPKIALPIVCAAAISGLSAYFFHIEGTPMSAGFGFSGMIGPINFLSTAPGGWNASNLLVAALAFVIIPCVTSAAFIALFTKLGVIQKEDYFVAVE